MFSLFGRAFLLNSLNDGDGIKWDSESNEFIAPRIELSFGKGLLNVINSYDTYETINTETRKK